MIDWLKNIYEHLTNLRMDQIEQLLHQYSSLGPLPGIIIPMMEALLSFLPLFVIIAANASAYGLWWGFLYSWIGVSIGAIILFLIARIFGKRLSSFVQRKYPRSRLFFRWIERQGFTPLFLLYCFPFTPSFFIDIAAGMSTIRKATFILALVPGKAVMVFIISFIGHDWQGFIHYPWRIPLLIVCLYVLWFVGKKIEQRYQIQ